MQIVPLRFCHIDTKKERSVAFKIRQNPFSAGPLPRTPLGELTTLPSPLVGWGGDIPPHTPLTRRLPTFGACHAFPRIPARSTPVPSTNPYKAEMVVKTKTCVRVVTPDADSRPSLVQV